MVIFTRLPHLGKSFIICTTAGFLLAKLNNDNEIHKEKLTSTINQVDLICQAYKEKQGIPGISVGVTMHGSIVWRKGYGLADIEQRVACTPDTVMRIASISKTFAITIAGQLFEQGKFNWDDSIHKHYSDLPKFFYENSSMSITMRQLASHTSGVRHYWKKGEKEAESDSFLSEFYLNRTFSNINDSLKIFINDELIHAPGTTWLYTTHGYTLLSAVLERISGDKRTFAELCNDLVVRQLGLRYTKLEYPSEIVPYRSRYYCRQSTQTGVRNVAYVDLSYKWAGGGMLSNVSDLLTFANALLQCYQTKSIQSEIDKLLLKRETLREMWSPMVSIAKRKYTSYGLGWMISKERSSSIDEFAIPFHVYHTGGAVGATSILLIIPCSNNCPNPRCGICISILTNLQDAGDIYDTALDIAMKFRQISPCSSQYTL